MLGRGIKIFSPDGCDWIIIFFKHACGSECGSLRILLLLFPEFPWKTKRRAVMFTRDFIEKKSHGTEWCIFGCSMDDDPTVVYL